MLQYRLDVLRQQRHPIAESVACAELLRQRAQSSFRPAKLLSEVARRYGSGQAHSLVLLCCEGSGDLIRQTRALVNAMLSFFLA